MTHLTVFIVASILGGWQLDMPVASDAECAQLFRSFDELPGEAQEAALRDLNPGGPCDGWRRRTFHRPIAD